MFLIHPADHRQPPRPEGDGEGGHTEGAGREVRGRRKEDLLPQD